MPASNSFFLTSFTSPRSVAENNIFISCACQDLHPPGAAAQIRRVRIIASGIHRKQSLKARQTGGGLLLIRVSVLTCRDAVSLSSFRGEGQGEEVVVLSRQARHIRAAMRWKFARNRTSRTAKGLLSPSPHLQSRRGRATRQLLSSGGCVRGADCGGASGVEVISAGKQGSVGSGPARQPIRGTGRSVTSSKPGGALSNCGAVFTRAATVAWSPATPPLITTSSGGSPSI